MGQWPTSRSCCVNCGEERFEALFALVCLQVLLVVVLLLLFFHPVLSSLGVGSCTDTDMLLLSHSCGSVRHITVSSIVALFHPDNACSLIHSQTPQRGPVACACPVPHSRAGCPVCGHDSGTRQVC